MSEAKFSRAITAMWREHGCFVQRIETGSITRGVPDVYIANREGAVWVELKVVRWKPYDGMQVPWRPGQQGWMLEYWKMTGRKCYTIVKCASCYLVIPMVKRFKNNLVMLADVLVYHRLQDLIL